MNVGYHQAAGYVAPCGAKKDKQRMKEQWDEYQLKQSAQRIAKSNTPEDRSSSAKTSSRRRAESQSVPQPYAGVSTYAEGQRRFSSASYRHSTLSPTYSNPPSEMRRLSGSFNAPTHVELERHENHQKSLKGVDRLRKWESRVKGWVRA